VNEKLVSLLKPVPESFLEKIGPIEDSDYVLFAAPLDKTASYRSGSRFAPQAIRQASQFMESYSIRTGFDWENLFLMDAGDVLGMENVDCAISNIQSVTNEIAKLGKTPVMLGGEHTTSLGAIRALKPQLLIVFDAHLDLRDELFDEKICHATYLRRAHEELGFKLVVVAARSLSREEIDYAKSQGVIIITALDIKRKGAENAIHIILKILESVESAYLSIDMDAIDPAEAPAVGNPCPEGITVTQLLDVINGIMSPKFIGIDINEVSPYYDSGNTAIQAGYILLETLYSRDKALTRSPS